MCAGTRPSDRHDADPFIRTIAELAAPRCTLLAGRRREAGNISREFVVRGGPIANQRKIVRETIWNDIVRIADEDRAVARAGMLFNALEHLEIVITRETRFGISAVRHWYPADEIR